MDTEARPSRLSLRYLLGLPLGLIFLAAAFAFTANVWVVHQAEPYVYGDVETIPPSDVGLLLGTSPYTRNGNGSRLFRHRVEAAVDLYRAGKIRHIIASGANPDETYNEPRQMYRALVIAGVPPEAITMDFAGFRTLDSVIRAGTVFGQGHFTIISQRFHDYRAVFIAREYGLQAVAYAAPEEKEQQKRHVLVREFLARVNAVLDVYVLKTVPRFLGEPIVLDIAPPQPLRPLPASEADVGVDEEPDAGEEKPGGLKSTEDKSKEVKSAEAKSNEAGGHLKQAPGSAPSKQQH